MKKYSVGTVAIALVIGCNAKLFKNDKVGIAVSSPFSAAPAISPAVVDRQFAPYSPAPVYASSPTPSHSAKPSVPPKPTPSPAATQTSIPTPIPALTQSPQWDEEDDTPPILDLEYNLNQFTFSQRTGTPQIVYVRFITETTNAELTIDWDDGDNSQRSAVLEKSEDDIIYYGRHIYGSVMFGGKVICVVAKAAIKTVRVCGTVIPQPGEVYWYYVGNWKVELLPTVHK